MTTAVRGAACQYPVGFLSSWADYEAKLRGWVGEAASEGARLLVFPEYAGLELASLLPESQRGTLGGQLFGLQGLLTEYFGLHSRLAKAYGVYLLAGSVPVRIEDGTYRNRAHLFGPTGASGFQEKVQMTRFERERWGISCGGRLTVFETELGRIGVCICYDSEFPLLARSLVEAGVEILLVPSCTDTDAGACRIEIACRARALEGQCFVLQAPTVGEAPWSEAIDRNIGRAGIYVPPDRGFPHDGVVAAGPWNQPAWVYADLDLELAREVRRDGQVLVWQDWTAQTQALGTPERVRV